MADNDGVFEAVPAKVQTGGGLTDQISQLIKTTDEWFSHATAFDPQNPPWGDDAIGDGFAENYVKVHAQLRDAVTSFATSVTRAGELTLNSGKNFEKTQGNALDDIHREGGKH